MFSSFKIIWNISVKLAEPGSILIVHDRNATENI